MNRPYHGQKGPEQIVTQNDTVEVEQEVHCQNISSQTVDGS